MTDVLDPLRARITLEAHDRPRALRVEAVDPIPYCGCSYVHSARDVPGCERCGGRLRVGTPWRWRLR